MTFLVLFLLLLVLTDGVGVGAVEPGLAVEGGFVGSTGDLAPGLDALVDGTVAYVTGGGRLCLAGGVHGITGAADDVVSGLL